MHKTVDTPDTQIQRVIGALTNLVTEAEARLAAAHDEGDMEAWLLRYQARQTAVTALLTAMRAAYGPGLGEAAAAK